MKKLNIIILLVFLSQLLYAQSIVIGDGSNINVGDGADICAGEYGNITGNLTGGGTECGVPIWNLSWILQNSGTTNTLRGVSFTDANTGTAVGGSGYGIILRTDNGGTNWISQTSGADDDLYSVSFTDFNNGTAVGLFGKIYRTTNGGATWIPQNSQTSEQLFGVSFTDANNGTAVGTFKRIRRTTDGGNTWTAQFAGGGITPDLYGVSFTDANTGTIVGSNYGSTVTILRTTDGGATWTWQTSGIAVVYRGVSFTDANNGTAVGYGGTIIRTTNGGTNWTSQSSGTTHNLYGVCFTDANNGTAVGDSGTIIRTTNGGAIWTLQTSGTTNRLYGVSFTDAYNGTAVGEDGTILRTTNGGGTPVTTFQLTVPIADGWNMVSVPGLHPTDQNVNTWWAFRDPGANVFRYSGGYQPITNAAPGLGYWMKHSGARTYNTGDEWPAGGIQIVPHAPLTAAAGWNLIGGYELSVTAANVTTNPPGLQSGPIYKYSGGYQVATTLDPGYGYWLKLTAAGQIIIPETFAKGTEVVEYFPENWGRILITDATGINYTLYAVKGEVDLSQYEMPPAPPEGMFDVRFSSGKIAEDINSAVKTIEMSGVVYPLTVRVEGMDIRLMDESGKMLNANLKSGEDVVISDATIQKLMVSGELLPTVYALEQNYPNPFNPSTMIEFSLPEDVANVKLSIYNALGEKVAELVNTALTAGKYQYQWNAQNVATGMYIYELRTDKFVSVKKMVLLR